MPVDARTRVRTTFSSGKGKRQEEDKSLRVEHPLQKHSPKTPSFSSSFDGTLTRPNLRRQVRGGSFHESTLAEESRPEHHARSHSDSGCDDWADTPGASTSASTTSELPPTLEDTREVVVHQVQATDSLAGVALKYGVKIAALRKANKLWPSDSIHLRKVLYIPVDWQRKTKQSAPIAEVDEQLAGTSASTSHDTEAIQRIANTEFSFFPSRPSLFSDETSLSTSYFPTHSTLPAPSSRRQIPNVFDVFSNGMGTIAQMSTDSLSSLTRTSTSDEPPEVELQVARETWRTANPPLQSPPPQPAPRPAEYSAAAKSSVVSIGFGGTITNRQPKGVAPMAIPTSPPRVRH